MSAMLMASQIPTAGQRDGKGEGRDVGQHAMAKIVRFFPGPLVARQVIRLVSDILLESRLARIAQPSRRARRGARPELEHAVLFFRRDGPLGFHCCQLRDHPDLCLARPHVRLTENVDTAGDAASYASKVSWNRP